MDIVEFLAEHLIIQSRISSQNYCFLEAIFDNPEDVIILLQKSKYHICHISWWDYVKIGDSSPIGYGGMRDPKNPKYYFAETDICQDFIASTSSEEYCDYFLRIKEMYPNLVLFPSFDIVQKE